MAVQVIYKETPRSIFFHPLQHNHQLMFVKMMAEKRRKDDGGFIFCKTNITVICQHPNAIEGRILLFCKFYTFGFYIDAGKICGNIIFVAPFTDRI